MALGTEKSSIAVRPEHLDPSFDDIIKDAGTQRLSTEQKIKYMEALHLNERERLVIREGGYIIGKEDGLEEGRAEGRAEKQVEVARTMLADGMSPELVSKYTGLSEEDIAKLK
jgi:predicted transposase/invertase (TIGR01784 family)